MPRNIGTGSSGGLTGLLDFVDNSILTIVDGDTAILDPDGVGTITTDAQVEINSGTASNSIVNGALVVTGGIGALGSVNIGGSITAASVGNIPIGQTTPAAATFTDLTVTGNSTINATSDVLVELTGASGTVTHDFEAGNNFFHTSISGNFKANITNLPTTNNRIYSINLILVQGGNPYYASQIAINSVDENIEWGGYVLPSPQANRTEVQTIQLIRYNNIWTVTSYVTSFG